MISLYWFLGVGLLALAVLGARKRLTRKEVVSEPPSAPEEPVFAVTPDDLQEKLSRSEIEAREMVTDPLKAVPELPFGHLNAAWQAFLKDMTDEDELWFFVATWEGRWERKHQRSGYVIVREGKPGPHFVTLWKYPPSQRAAGEAC